VTKKTENEEIGKKQNVLKTRCERLKKMVKGIKKEDGRAKKQRERK